MGDTSPLHGVGVFAVRPIPVGVNPFHTCNEHLMGVEECISVSEGELLRFGVSEVVVDLVKSFFAPLTREEDNDTPVRSTRDGTLVYGINATGLTTLDAS